MRVLLVKPPHGNILGLEMMTFVEPLGLECVAGCLEPMGHECKILDLRIPGETIDKGLRWDPQFVGVQCNFTTERYRTLRIAQAFKQKRKDIFVVLGGHDVSREPEFFQCDAVDALVIGDGEEVAPILVDALDHGKDLKNVPGLLMRTSDGSWINTGHAPARRNLDDLPFPARHLIKPYAKQYYIGFHKPMALLETARGCPYRCNFCSVWKFHEKTFREKSPERVVKELQMIPSDYVFFTDDIFWLNVERGKEMARQIKAAGIKKWFTMQTRTDLICRHPELIEMWKECGKLSIFIGVEKIDDEGLQSVNKHNKAINNERAIEILKEMKVGFSCNFITDPNWDHEDFERLRQYVLTHGLHQSGFTVLTPLPGTDLWDEVKDQVNTTNYELFDLMHPVLPTKLPLEEFYKEYASLWVTVQQARDQGFQLYRLMKLVKAIATGKFSFKQFRKGMNMHKRFSRWETYLETHRTQGQVAQLAWQEV